MASYELMLTGTGDPDDVRSAFEDFVRAVRSDAEPTGDLTLDGVPYAAEDVPDAADLETDDAAAPDDIPTTSVATDTAEDGDA